jgi:hypothetical protein
MKLLLTILFALTVTACGGGGSSDKTVELTPEGIPVADTLWGNKSWDNLYWQ